MRVQVVEIWVRILILFIFLACSSPREKQGCISEQRCPQETTPGKKQYELRLLLELYKDIRVGLEIRYRSPELQ
jgi:hypothetical protein